MLPETLNVFGYQATGIDRYAFVFAGGFVFFFLLIWLEALWQKAFEELNDDLARNSDRRRGGRDDVHSLKDET